MKQTFITDDKDNLELEHSAPFFGSVWLRATDAATEKTVIVRLNEKQVVKLSQWLNDLLKRIEGARNGSG